jgi:hypothetical protein
MTYQIIITEEVANVAVTSESYPIIIEYNATNISANATYGNTEVASYLASGTNASIIDNIGNISTVGSMAAGGSIFASGLVSVTGNISTQSNVSATGNITGSYFLGNGSQLTGLPATYGNANVAANLAAFGSNPISTSGNITAGYVVGNGSLLSALTGANVSGTVANATYALNANAATFATQATFADTANAVAGANVTGTVANATYALNANASTFAGTVTTAAQPTITSVGTLTSLSVSGNVSGGNIYSPGAIETIGSFIGNGAGLTNIPGSSINGTVANATYAISAGSATTATSAVSAATANTVTDAAQGNITSVGTLTSLSVSGNITSGNVVSLGTVTAVGNITGANLVATANLTSTQQTVVGTANTGTTGNIVMSGKNIATDMAFVPDGATGAAAYQGKVTVGTGWNGNLLVGNFSRMSVMDMINRGNTASQIRELEAESLVNLTANVTNNSFRHQAIGGRIRVGGGSAGNVTALGSAFGVPFSMAAAQNNLEVGNITPYFLGNTAISHATLNSGVLTLNAGSSIGNAYGYVPGIASGGSGGTANITNYIGVASTFAGANVTGNLFCFYNGNAASLGAYAVQTANSARAATNYYFLRNDDDVAQAKLGSLRTYHEFESATATSGSFAIDKATAQVHNIVPTANCTITGYSNMVTSASDGTNTDSQVDTLTIIVEQGATPYYITLPTGAAYKYAGNVSTVGVTANSVTMISVTAANVSGTVTYLTTVSPEFV